jgi:hypothetical protein
MCLTLCVRVWQRDDLAPYSRDEDDADIVAAAAAGVAAPAKAPPLGPAAGGFEMSTKIATLLRGLAAYAHPHPHICVHPHLRSRALTAKTRCAFHICFPFPRLRSLPKGTKSLVFSQWTSMLDIVAPFLAAAGVAHARLDGSMSAEERAAAVERFTHDPGCAVFALSLKAGGVGLHLVAATHVWLLDPCAPLPSCCAVAHPHRKTLAYLLCACVCFLPHLCFSRAQVVEPDGGAAGV